MKRKLKKLLEFKKTTKKNEHQEDATETDNKNEDILHFEKQMADDMGRMIDKWYAMRIPKANALIFSSMYWVNFVFSCVDSEKANFILAKAISRELVRHGDISSDETITQ